MNTTRVFTTFLFLMVCGSHLFADGKTREQFPLQLQILSGNVGVGPSVGYNINKIVMIGVDALSKSETAEESTYYGSTTNQATGTASYDTTIIYSRFSVWDDSGFYLQLGATSRDWLVEVTGPTYIGSYTTGYTYSSSTTVTFEWPKTATMAGLGWNWIGDSGFSGGFGLQSFSGEPETKVTDNTGSATAAQIEAEEEYWKTVADLYAPSSNIYINIGWNF